MADFPLDSLLLACRALVEQSPELAAFEQKHLFNTAFTVTNGPYWAETMEVTGEEPQSVLSAPGSHTERLDVEYVVKLVCPKDEGTGRIWTAAKEVKQLCPSGLGVNLESGQATIMRAERLGPRAEGDDFVMTVRLEILAYSTQ